MAVMRSEMINSAQLSDVMEYGIGIIMENRHGLIPGTGSGPEVISFETSSKTSSPRFSLKLLPDDHSACPPMSAPCHQITGPVTLDTAPRLIMSQDVTCHNFWAPVCRPGAWWSVIITVSLSRVTRNKKVLKSSKDARVTIICSVTSSYHNSRLM